MSELATAWTANPWLIALLGGALLLYLRGDRRRAHKRQSHASAHSLERSAFFAALATLVVALLSPLDRLSDLSFAAHMTQHELLMLLAAPLLVLARPFPTYLQALPGAWRSRVANLARQPWALRGFRIATAPVLALLLHGAIRWVWHLPELFEAALASEWVHGVQHASFFVSALLFWWGLLQGRSGRAGYGLAALFVLATAIHTGALGALLALSENVWYPAQARGGLLELAPLHDQQLAGLIMWVGAFVWLLMLALALLFAWLGEARRQAARSSVARVGLVCLAVALTGCSRRDVALAESITAGDVARGRHAFHRLGCGSCHEIDGDRTTQGHAGPALNDFALQSYLPGGLANEPEALMHWIRHPREVVPDTAMPDLGVREQDARDLAAYLYTLR